MQMINYKMILFKKNTVVLMRCVIKDGEKIIRNYLHILAQKIMYEDLI